MSPSDADRERSVADDRRDRTLPVTEEVGSEGGSYADPTYQVATFGGHDALRTADRTGPPATGGESTDRPPVADQGVGGAPGPASGMVRYPTEPPSRRAARQGWTAVPWKAAALAAAAGAAAALLLRPRRR